MDELGVARDAYDGIVTSGDVTRAPILSEQSLAKRVLHIGPERDKGIFEDLDIVASARRHRADVVVCSGLFDDTNETPDDYRDVHRGPKGATARSPMLCANPDLMVERGEVA